METAALSGRGHSPVPGTGPDPKTSLSPQPQDTYKYTQLGHDESIRILTLYPGSGDDPLAGDLEEAELTREPAYEAISYVWGSTRRAAQIICRGYVLAITQSVHDAVARMRHPTEPRRLWADQICINQNDVSERSQQVRLMNNVYKTARHVLVWLGHDREGVATDAVNMLHYLDKVFQDEAAHDKFRRAHSIDLASQSQTPWMPLTRLTRLPWFHRIWIVQEIGTTAPATLFWGSAHIDWDKLSFVAGILNDQYHYLRTRFNIGTPNIRYLFRRFVEPDEPDVGENHNRGNFIYELHRARHLLARDPRDHVYAFLGHFSKGRGSRTLADLRADYSLSVDEVYVDAAIRGLTDASSLILLSANHNPPNSSPNSLVNRKTAIPGNEPLKLPSWVPDWRIVPVHIMGNPYSLHRAAAESTPDLSIDEGQRILHIRGVRVDAIARRSWVFFGKAFHFQQGWVQRHGRVRQHPLESLWRDVCGFRMFNLSRRYREAFVDDVDADADAGTGSAFFALVQSLTNACMGFDLSRSYESVPKDEWLHHAAAYLTRSGVDPDVIVPAIHNLARHGDPFKWSHRATLVTRYRRFAVTEQGYYVMGPESMEDGDVVVILYGGKTPFVLRRRGPGADDGWIYIGECYAHGLMDGEALARERVQDEVFSIH